MTPLTSEQHRLFKQHGEKFRLVDPDTQQEYVLLRAEFLDRLGGALTEIDPREMYPALERAMKDEGWDAPEMDDYNRYG